MTEANLVIRIADVLARVLFLGFFAWFWFSLGFQFGKAAGEKNRPDLPR